MRERAEIVLSADAAIALFDCQNLFALPRNKIPYSCVCLCLSVRVCVCLCLSCLSLNRLFVLCTVKKSYTIYLPTLAILLIRRLEHFPSRVNFSAILLYIDSLLIFRSYHISILLPGLKVCAYRIKAPVKRENENIKL